MQRCFRRIVYLGFVCLAYGCGPSPAAVSGNVTLDGQPLDTGYITYAPAEGEGIPITADIRNGAYQLQVMPGKKFVQISAPKVVGTRKDSDSPNAVTVEITEEQLGDQYTSGTELTFDVQPGANNKDWVVQSKARK